MSDGIDKLIQKLQKVSDLRVIDAQIQKIILDHAKSISPVDSGAFRSGWTVGSDGHMTIWLRPQNKYIDEGYTRNGAGTVNSREWNGTPYSVRAIREKMNDITTLVRKHLEQVNNGN